jgi:hypothetical protein
VIAVGAPAEDVKEKVELSRRGIPAQFHCEMAKRSSTPWLLTRMRVGRFCSS